MISSFSSGGLLLSRVATLRRFPHPHIVTVVDSYHLSFQRTPFLCVQYAHARAGGIVENIQVIANLPCLNFMNTFLTTFVLCFRSSFLRRICSDRERK